MLILELMAILIALDEAIKSGKGGRTSPSLAIIGYAVILAILLATLAALIEEWLLKELVVYGI